MRQPPPHNPAQAFLDDQERRAAQFPNEDGLVGPNGNALSGDGRASGVISPASLQGQPIPERRWIVEGLIPVGNVTMLAGDGGLGKSLLAMQLLTCVSIGKPWLGLPTAQCKALAVFCEDERDELHIRQASINEHYDCAFSDLSSCLWMPRVGEANVMRHFGDRGPSEPTKFYREVKDRAKAAGARLIVIDSLHDVFSGNENIRGNARQFISDLRAIILPVDGAVLLLSHPSMSGMSSGTGAAGSTAWHNAVRSRLYLTRPVRKSSNFATEAEDDGDPNERVLKTMKSNYGSLGGNIPLRWERGVFVRQDSGQALSFVETLEVDRLVVDALRHLVQQDTRVALNPHAKNSLPTMVRKVGSAKHLSWQTVAAAQVRLLAAGKIVRTEMGPSKNRLVAFLRTPENFYPGEAKEGGGK
jgi:RecA-family ATPase